MTIKAILTDIEGTITDIAFVRDTLFPYARAALPAYVRDHADENTVGALLDDVRSMMHQPRADTEAVIGQLQRWMGEDRKITPLKQLQGLVWADGYRSGAFKGHLYEDALQRLRRWHEQGLRLFVFSSGSVKAQQLLFAHTEYGDINSLFDGYFDTVTGPKTSAASYGHIAAKIELRPEKILFLSDVAAELDAAREAGMQTLQVVRDDAATGNHPVVTNLEKIDSEAFA